MAGERKLHIVMFPWLAFGHILPYLELAKLIAHKGHLVSFVSTPRNVDRIPKLPPNLATLIRFVKLALPKVEKLPENAEATSDVPYNVVQYLKKAYDGLQQPLTEFLQSSEADWILHDFAPYWAGAVASKLGVKTAFFSIFTPSAVGFIGPVPVLKGDDLVRTKPEDFTVSPDWVPFPLQWHGDCTRLEGSSTLSTKMTQAFRIYIESVQVLKTVIMAVRSCSEFEPEWLQVLEDIYQKPVLPVGQLPSTVYDDEDDNNDTFLWIKDWLNIHEKGTVVYVAFGSEAKPSQEEVQQIALGLEKSDLPFFCVLRVCQGPTDPEVLELPEGFKERTRERRVVWTSWAPQLKILGHDSIGGFLTHSSWTSVIEAIQTEKPLVLLTFLADQGLNARILEEKKMGYSIPRDEQDGSFPSDSVADSVRLVMLKEEGRIYKEKIIEVKDSFVSKDRQ